MKKIINDPSAIVEEMLAGLVASYPPVSYTHLTLPTN